MGVQELTNWNSPSGSDRKRGTESGIVVSDTLAHRAFAVWGASSADSLSLSLSTSAAPRPFPCLCSITNFRIYHAIGGEFSRCMWGGSEVKFGRESDL